MPLMAEETRRWASSCGRGEIETITAPLAGRLIEEANVLRVCARVCVCVRAARRGCACVCNGVCVCVLVDAALAATGAVSAGE